MNTVENLNRVDGLFAGTAEFLPRFQETQAAGLPEIRLTAIEDELPKLYFDVRKFSVEDLTRILAECRQAELAERVSVFELKFDSQGHPLQKRDDGSYVRMMENVRTKLDWQEISAMQMIRELSLDGSRAVAWFSPNGGNSQYVENRITVAVLRETEADGSMVFDCRGICTKHGREDFYCRVKNVITDNNTVLSEIKSPDDLRNCPVGLNIEESWFEYLAQFFDDIPEVFEAIAEGRDIRNMFRLREVAQNIGEELRRRGRKSVSFWDAVEEGAYLERVIKTKFNIDLMAGGGHGSSNSAVYERAQSRVVSKDTPGAKYCRHCGVYYVGNDCPVCGKPM